MINRHLTILTAVTALMMGATLAFAGDAPGVIPAPTPGVIPIGAQLKASEAAQFARVPTAQGLKVFYDKFGTYRPVIGAKGSNLANGHVITIAKPAGAVVDKAYLMSASYYGTAINNGDVAIDSKPVTWIEAVINGIPKYPTWFYSVRGDVTSLIKAKTDAAPAGNVSFKLTENAAKNSYIDGEVLVVVFKLPSGQARNTLLLFGGLKTTGDNFDITLAAPINMTTLGARVDMGLGISYSFQSSSITNQISQVSINGSKVSSSAGGQDDGDALNGALITAGGMGDSRTNPANPFRAPTGPRYDDELYNLLPHVSSTSKLIRVSTYNPSDDDNIFFAWFDVSANADINKDTDSDGLLDSWERFGYDKNNDGIIDVNLPTLGANYLKKDIFIGYVWMNKSATETVSHYPSAAVITAVKNAFAAAPASNPNGTTGINVHFINKGSAPHDNDLNPAWSQFDAIMNPKFTSAEKDVFHRLLLAHGHSGGSSSGLSRGIPASDFIETLGKWNSNPGTYKQRAGTIMHELGHNLGLRHGGPDHENYKPNHLSIMSYLNQMDWLLKGGVAKIDYERFNLQPLNENSLSEAAGLNRYGGDTPIATYGVRWMKDCATQTKTTGANANDDWNKSGAINGSNIAMDLNCTNTKSTLKANYVEWSNIVYEGGDIGGSIASQGANEITSWKDLDELTQEKYLQMQIPSWKGLDELTQEEYLQMRIPSWKALDELTQEKYLQMQIPK